MIGGAAYSLMKYTYVNTLLDVELKAVTRKRAAVSSVRCAAAAAARSTPSMHVDNDSAEGTHSAQERRDRSDHPAAAPDQGGDGRRRDGQTPEREQRKTARKVQLS